MNRMFGRGTSRNYIWIVTLTKKPAGVLCRTHSKKQESDQQWTQVNVYTVDQILTDKHVNCLVLKDEACKQHAVKHSLQ